MNKSWIRGKYKDMQSVDLVQVIPIDVIGDWHLGNNVFSVFLVKNERTIDIAFKRMLISLQLIIYDGAINSRRCEPRAASKMDAIQELTHSFHLCCVLGNFVN